MRAFNLFEAVVVTCVMAVLIAIYLPRLIKPPRCGCRMYCSNNLKQIELSFRQWALDNNDKLPMQVSVTNGGMMELVANGDLRAIFLVMSNELNTPKILQCPEDNTRTSAVSFLTNFSGANVSYFVGVDADGSNPQMFLAGDDNLAVNGVPVKRGWLTLSNNSQVAWTAARHTRQGNAALADGSVQGFSNARLREALQNTGVATNRLLLP